MKPKNLVVVFDYCAVERRQRNVLPTGGQGSSKWRHNATLEYLTGLKLMNAALARR